MAAQQSFSTFLMLLPGTLERFAHEWLPSSEDSSCGFLESARSVTGALAAHEAIQCYLGAAQTSNSPREAQPGK